MLQNSPISTNWLLRNYSYNVEVVINQYTKPIDQQGLGDDEGDCGSIAIQNIKDYLVNFNIVNHNFNHYTILSI